MNVEKVSDALVKAAMAGVKQIKGSYMDFEGGRCAMGVLGDACGAWERLCHPRLDIMVAFDLTEEDCRQIVLWNDAGVDFLTIARKIGNQEETK